MALSSMQKLLLIGNVSERNTLIKKLHKLGCVEVTSTPEIERMSNTDIWQDIDECKVKIAKLEFCLQTLKDSKITAKKLAKDKKIDYIPAKGSGMFAIKQLITFENFEKLSEIETDVFTQIDKLKEYKDEIVALKASAQKENSLIASLAPYMKMPVAFSKFKDTSNVNVILGEVK
ncbi:MAG: hypothetical protein K2O95_01985, partial [Clostridia bacterium]|nr:hypothetical protein [Clostridia bacterium]